MNTTTQTLIRPRYIAGLLGIVIGLRIASALAILLLWFPVLNREPNLFTDPSLLFPFIQERQGQWRGAMFAGVLTSAVAVPLSVFLSRYFSRNEAMDESFLFIGAGALMIDIVATIMSFLGTAWLANHYVQQPELTTYVFHWSEAWRDEGLKTVAFLGIGLFTMRIAWTMHRAPRSAIIQTFSWLYGSLMVLIGVMDAFGRFRLGEYGVVSGFGHIFYALWGLSIGHWFWFRAVPRETFLGSHSSTASTAPVSSA